MRHVRRQRATHAASLLAAGGAKIVDAAFDSGFGPESRFYPIFRAAIGLTPRDYARAHGNAPRP